MTKKKINKTHRIPEFTNIAEEAKFWDTHSTAAYEGAFRPVRVRFAKKLSEAITIPLNPRALEKVRSVAEKQGISPTTLIHKWVSERLKEKERV